MDLPANQIILGNVLEILPTLDTESIDCCVTSPPYWGLRDYGCEGQIGLEKTPEEFVEQMVKLFGEVRRILKPNGTLWLNLGNSYWANRTQLCEQGGEGLTAIEYRSNQGRAGNGKHSLIKPKDLCGIPWRVAFALQSDGWWLRQDIIWHKPNPMPESVTDRCTKAHEYIFLLSKSAKYFYDAEAIKEEAVEESLERAMRAVSDTHKNLHIPGQSQHSIHRARANGEGYPMGQTRNKRSVWSVTTAPFKEAHFATFPPKLIEPCILAGCPEWVCKKCGKPRERIVEASDEYEKLKSNRRGTHGYESRGLEAGNRYGSETGGLCKSSKTVGWTDCGCGAGFRPGVVLDPFMGSGTTGMVAAQNRRNWLGIELNPVYAEIATKRINTAELGLTIDEQRAGQLALFTEAK